MTGTRASAPSQRGSHAYVPSPATSTATAQLLVILGISLDTLCFSFPLPISLVLVLLLLLLLSLHPHHRRTLHARCHPTRCRRSTGSLPHSLPHLARITARPAPAIAPLQVLDLFQHFAESFLQNAHAAEHQLAHHAAVFAVTSVGVPAPAAVAWVVHHLRVEAPGYAGYEATADGFVVADVGAEAEKVRRVAAATDVDRVEVWNGLEEVARGH